MYLERPVQLPAHIPALLLGMIQSLDIKPGPGGSRFSDYQATKNLVGPVLVDFFDYSQCAVVALYPSSQIVAHQDAPIPGQRFHIVLQTNSGCWVFSGGLWQQLRLGRTYQMDPTEEHGAVNWGAEIRLHLVVDVG